MTNGSSFMFIHSQLQEHVLISLPSIYDGSNIVHINVWVRLKIFSARYFTEQIHAVMNCTPIHVKIKSKLTNFENNSRIEGYNGK